MPPQKLLYSSAFLDRRLEDVRVQAVVIAELELGDIERQIFAAGRAERQLFYSGLYAVDDVLHRRECKARYAAYRQCYRRRLRCKFVQQQAA